MDVNHHERLSETKSKYSNIVFIADLHLSVTAGSSWLYLNTYWRDNSVCFWLLSLKIQPEITIVLIIHSYFIQNEAIL